YGGRAAYGVVLITTKKGKRNTPTKLSYSNNLTFSRATNLPEKASTLETIDAFTSWGNTYYSSGQDLATWKDLITDYQSNPSKYPDGKTTVNGMVYPLSEHNIYDIILRNSFEHMHNFSFSGGSEKADFRASFGYADEDGIMITNKDGYKKFNVNLLLNANLTKNLTSTSNILFTSAKTSTPAEYQNIFNMALRMGTYNYDPSRFTTTTDGSKIPYSTPENELLLELPDVAENSNLRIFQKLNYELWKNVNLVGEYTDRKST